MSNMTATGTQMELSEALDKLLLDIIRNGRDVPVEGGEVVTVKASASDMQAAIARLKMCNVAPDPAKSGVVSEIVDQMRKRNESAELLPALTENERYGG